MLYSSRDQLAMDLCYLAREDSQLYNDIIYNYCQLINDKQFNDLKSIVLKNVNQLSRVCIIITECNKHLRYALILAIINV